MLIDNDDLSTFKMHITAKLISQELSQKTSMQTPAEKVLQKPEKIW